MSLLHRVCVCVCVSVSVSVSVSVYFIVLLCSSARMHQTMNYLGPAVWYVKSPFVVLR